MAMFNRIEKPVVGGLIRSGTGTRLWIVTGVYPHPKTPNQWLCSCVLGGHVKKGVWHEPNYFRSRENWVATNYWIRPVRIGKDAPQVPARVAHIMRYYSSKGV